jgi:hypothetical protein
MSTLLRLCAVEELASGSRRVIEVEASQEVLVLNIAGTVYAISNVCPHEGAALQRGQVERTVFTVLSIVGVVHSLPVSVWMMPHSVGGPTGWRPKMHNAFYTQVNTDALLREEPHAH